MSEVRALRQVAAASQGGGSGRELSRTARWWQRLVLAAIGVPATLALVYGSTWLSAWLVRAIWGVF
jgi:hypothetical protein